MFGKLERRHWSVYQSKTSLAITAYTIVSRCWHSPRNKDCTPRAPPCVLATSVLPPPGCSPRACPFPGECRTPTPASTGGCSIAGRIAGRLPSCPLPVATRRARCPTVYKDKSTHVPCTKVIRPLGKSLSHFTNSRLSLFKTHFLLRPSHLITP